MNIRDMIGLFAPSLIKQYPFNNIAFPCNKSIVVSGLAFICTRPSGHDADFHVAHGSEDKIEAVWPVDETDEISLSIKSTNKSPS